MKAYTERLEAAIEAKNNPTVLGLDPRPEYLPAFLQTGQPAEALLRFNRALIDAVGDLIPAVKPQLAYYERLGEAGLHTFYQTIAYAREKGLLVIVDGKRNDIGSTAEAYAEAYLDHPDVDALTVNAYLGEDGIRPFLERAAKNGKAIYALVRTSNKSAGDLQDLVLTDGRKVYEAVADCLNDWSQEFVTGDGFSPLGAVVGATWPTEAAALRRRLPHASILVPGYGAQGATADDCTAHFLETGRGAVVNASRSLMLAWRQYGAEDADSFREASRLAALAMRKDLEAALQRAGKTRS